jgi:hypothetical protein
VSFPQFEEQAPGTADQGPRSGRLGSSSLTSGGGISAESVKSALESNGDGGDAAGCLRPAQRRVRG